MENQQQIENLTKALNDTREVLNSVLTVLEEKGLIIDTYRDWLSQNLKAVDLGE